MGFQALAAVAQFGIWYELRRQRQVAEAQFEERRIVWLNDIVSQWMHEHAQQPGIVVDVTESMAVEASKVLDALLSNDSVDVPQSLLLKISRLCEYLDALNSAWSTVLTRVVDYSKSAAGWCNSASIQPSDRVVSLELVQLRQAHESAAGNIKKGMLGIAALLIPVVGPALGGGLIGSAAGGEVERRQALRKIDVLEQYPQLLRLQVASAQAVATATEARRFFEAQDLAEGVRLYALAAENQQTQLCLGPSQGRPWYSRAFIRSERPQLRALAAPLSA